MSGDHGREYYDEVNIMKDYAIEKVCLQKIYSWIMQVFQHMKACTEWDIYLEQK